MTLINFSDYLKFEAGARIYVSSTALPCRRHRLRDHRAPAYTVEPLHGS